MLMIVEEHPIMFSDIRSLIQEAFATAKLSDGTEHELVEALRKSDAYIPELSLVMQRHGSLYGYIMFTKAHVGETTVLALDPLCVKPSWQNWKIGTKLVLFGHNLARKQGYPYSVVFGDPAYYSRFGYVPAETLGIIAPEEIPKENLLAIKLLDDAAPISGVMTYAKEFEIDIS